MNDPGPRLLEHLDILAFDDDEDEEDDNPVAYDYCPECESSNVMQLSAPDESGLALMYCRDCGHKFHSIAEEFDL